MYYYTYLVIPTNIKSRLFGKVYFGKHKTENLNDGYIGSGTQILRYLNKHPNDYYREIIKFYSSEEELNKAEYDLIHPHINKSYCLNLMEGGHGGDLSKESREKCIKHARGKKRSEEQINNIRNGYYKSDIKTRHEKQRESLKKYYSDPIHKQEASERITKKWQDPEYRNKMNARIPRKINEAELKKRSESLKGKNKGKHKVWDNKELNIYHMEY